MAAAVGADGEARLWAFLANEPADRNPLYVLTLPARGGGPPLDVTAHTVDGVAVVEFEATGRTAAHEPDYYALVKKTVGRLQTADTLRQFLERHHGQVWVDSAAGAGAAFYFTLPCAGGGPHDHH